MEIKDLANLIISKDTGRKADDIYILGCCQNIITRLAKSNFDDADCEELSNIQALINALRQRMKVKYGLNYGKAIIYTGYIYEQLEQEKRQKEKDIDMSEELLKDLDDKIDDIYNLLNQVVYMQKFEKEKLINTLRRLQGKVFETEEYSTDDSAPF